MYVHLRFSLAVPYIHQLKAIELLSFFNVESGCDVLIKTNLL